MRSTTLLTLAAVATAGPVSAQAVSMSVDPVASDVEATVEVTFGTTDSDGPKPIAFSGDFLVDVSLVDDAIFGTVADSFAFQSGRLEVADTSFGVTVVQIFPIPMTITTEGMAGSFTSDTQTADAPPIATNTTSFDVDTLQIEFDEGIIRVAVPALGIDNPVDLSTESFFFDLAGAGTMVATPTAGPTELTLTLPMDSMTTVEEQGVTVTFTFEGNLVLTGSVSTPVPTLSDAGRWALAVSLLGLGAFLQRRGPALREESA